MLQVEEHGDAADGQEYAGQDRQQLLGLLARALERQRAGSAEHAAAPSGKGGEQNQRPLQFHDLLLPLPIAVAQDVHEAGAVAHVRQMMHV